jgi:hypothetical protein
MIFTCFDSSSHHQALKAQIRKDNEQMHCGIPNAYNMYGEKTIKQ